MFPREIWLTVHEVAELVQVQQETVRRWIRAGELPAVELGGPRSGYRVHREDLDHFLWQRYQTKRQNWGEATQARREAVAPRLPPLELGGQGRDPAPRFAGSDSELAAGHLSRHLQRQGSLASSRVLPCLTYSLEADGANRNVDYVNRALETFTGHPAEDFEAGRLRWEEIVYPDDFDQFEADWWHGLAAGEPFLLEYRIISPNQGIWWVQEEVVPVEEGGVTTGWDGIVFNVTGQREIEEALTTRLRQQEALLRFSQQTVLQPGLDPLFEEAVRFLAETLRVRFIRLYELRPGGEELFLRAGLGWREGLVGRLVVPADVATQAGYALLANTAVVVPDWRAEQRFTGPAFIREHGIISSLTTIIPGRGKPFGAMGVDSLTRRDFSEHDIVFLESVAAVLANAILSQEPEQPARWFTVSEVAARLQVSEETVRRWARAGELPVIKLGDYRSGYRIHPTDLDNFLRQRYSGGQPVAS